MPRNPYLLTEAQEGVIFVTWLRMKHLRHHHSPNETGHSLEARRRAVRVKREGTSPGFPDYMIFIRPDQSVDGQSRIIFVELKRQKGGTLSLVQREWIDSLAALGLPAYVARGAQEAIDVVSKHLKASKVEQTF